MLDKKSMIALTLPETIPDHGLRESIEPGSRILFETIQGLLEMAHFPFGFVIFKTRGDVHVDFFF